MMNGCELHIAGRVDLKKGRENHSLMIRPISGITSCARRGLPILVAPAQPQSRFPEASMSLTNGTFAWADSGSTDHTATGMTHHGALDAASVDGLVHTRRLNRSLVLW